VTHQQHTLPPWRVFDLFTNVEIVTDHPTANETESIVQFKGQRNALANARLIVHAVNSYDQLVRACRLLVDAYAAGGNHNDHDVEWDHIDMAHDAAVLALSLAEPPPTPPVPAVTTA
jgi:hypothetical protein